MAKLFKNVLLSLEEVFLNQPIPAEINSQVSKEIPEKPLIDEEQLEQIKAEAYEQGYLAGQSAERNTLDQEQTQLKQQIRETLAAIPTAIAQNRLHLQSEIADIVLLVTEQFFIEQQQNKQALNQQINQILVQLNSKQHVELCLHPQEINALQNGLIQLNAHHLNGLKIKGDETLLLGGCRIKTEHGYFDVSIEKQIEQLKEVLIQLRQRGQDETVD